MSEPILEQIVSELMQLDDVKFFKTIAMMNALIEKTKERNQEIADLRAKLEAAETERDTWNKDSSYQRDRAIAAEQERDNLQAQVDDLLGKGQIGSAEVLAEQARVIRNYEAQVAVMRGVLQQAQAIMNWHAIRCPMNIPNNYSGSEEHLAEYRAVYQRVIPQALSTTSAEAGERVRGLIKALTDISEESPDVGAKECAGTALAKYRGEVSGDE